MGSPFGRSAACVGALGNPHTPLFLKIIRRRNWRRDLEAELEFHRGMASARGNVIPLGRVSGIKEESADLWRFTFVESLWRDIVYGVRGLRKNPALVFGAAVSLTLGIGANLAPFFLTLLAIAGDLCAAPWRSTQHPR